MTHPAQFRIDRLYSLSSQATRLGHNVWAGRLEEQAIKLKRAARHELGRGELSPRQRLALGVREKTEMATLSLRISGEGITRRGLAAVRGYEQMYDAHAAISCLHDALLAVAMGDITPEQVRQFFWKTDLDEAKYIGDVISLDPTNDEIKAIPSEAT